MIRTFPISHHAPSLSDSPLRIPQGAIPTSQPQSHVGHRIISLDTAQGKFSSTPRRSTGTGVLCRTETTDHALDSKEITEA